MLIYILISVNVIISIVMYFRDNWNTLVTVTQVWFINQALLNIQKEVKDILSFLDVFNELSDHKLS